MPQTIRTVKKPIRANIAVPGSKSITYRALLLAALADGVSEIGGVSFDQDTKTLINALRQLGIVVQTDEVTHACIIAGGTGEFPKKQATIWCEDNRTVTNFLITACAASPGVYYFDGTQALRQRSIAQLLNLLHRQGAQMIPSDKRKLPFTLVGADSLEGGELILDNSITRQLISALLMIAPFARTAFNFSVVDLTSQPYIDLTCNMMAEFGVLVHRVHQGQFMVPVPQRYQARDYTIEPDIALANYFFAAAAITGGEITITKIKKEQSIQPASKLLSILEKMGCRIFETDSGLTLKGPDQLQGVNVSLREFGSVFLILAAIAPFAKSPVQISHLGPIKKFESKYMDIIQSQLKKMGVDIEAAENWIKIHPGKPNGSLIMTQHYASIAMAFSLIGLKVPGLAIDDPICVSKHYPEFFITLEKITELVSACA